MSLFLLFGLLAFSLALPSPAARSAPGERPFGVNSHSASRYPDPWSLAVPADAVAATGAGWAREDFQFVRLNPEPGIFDWQFTDMMVDTLAARGVQIIGVITGPTPAWAVPGSPGGDFYPPDPQTFAQFAATVAERYKGRVSFWEIWNEPDNARYWKPGPDPFAYAELLKAAYPAIKAANPEAQVLVGGLVTPEPALSFLGAIASRGAWEAFDIVSIHPYTDPWGPEEGQIDAVGVGAARALVERIGHKPIWATEFGWSTRRSRDGSPGVDEETQASFLVRSMALVYAAGAERVLWYNLKDTGGDEQYGLLREGTGLTDFSQPKPALIALRILNEQLAEAIPAGALDLGGQQVVEGFESFGGWKTGDQPNGILTQSSEQAHGGAAAARADYSFPGSGNDFVVFLPDAPLSLPDEPRRLGIWVAGDNSGHELKAWLRDAEGELLQFRLGVIGGGGWHFLSAAIDGQVEPWNTIGSGGNRRLDYPAAFYALALDDAPDGFAGSGTIFLDDLTAISGSQIYGQRFTRGDEIVDLLWAPGAATADLPAAASIGRLVDRWGNLAEIEAEGGRFRLQLGPSPVFVTYLKSN